MDSAVVFTFISYFIDFFNICCTQSVQNCCLVIFGILCAFFYIWYVVQLFYCTVLQIYIYLRKHFSCSSLKSNSCLLKNEQKANVRASRITGILNNNKTYSGYLDTTHVNRDATINIDHIKAATFYRCIEDGTQIRYNKLGMYYLSIDSCFYTTIENLKEYRLRDIEIIDVALLDAGLAGYLDILHTTYTPINYSHHYITYFELGRDKLTPMVIHDDTFADNDTPAFGEDLLINPRYYSKHIQLKKRYGKLFPPKTDVELACYAHSLGKWAFLPTVNNITRVQRFVPLNKKIVDQVFLISEVAYRVTSFWTIYAGTLEEAKSTAYYIYYRFGETLGIRCGIIAQPRIMLLTDEAPQLPTTVRRRWGMRGYYEATPFDTKKGL